MYRKFAAFMRLPRKSVGTAANLSAVPNAKEDVSILRKSFKYVMGLFISTLLGLLVFMVVEQLRFDPLLPTKKLYNELGFSCDPLACETSQVLAVTSHLAAEELEFVVPIVEIVRDIGVSSEILERNSVSPFMTLKN
jgi:hypothetical protein